MSTIERLAEKYCTFHHGYVQSGYCAFSPSGLAALIADVRQQAMEEAADICRQLYLHEDIDNSARDCYDAIRARLVPHEGKEEGKQ
jgi:hypothetical protein